MAQQIHQDAVGLSSGLFGFDVSESHTNRQRFSPATTAASQASAFLLAQHLRPHALLAYPYRIYTCVTAFLVPDFEFEFKRKKKPRPNRVLRNGLSKESALVLIMNLNRRLRLLDCPPARLRRL